MNFEQDAPPDSIQGNEEPLARETEVQPIKTPQFSIFSSPMIAGAIGLGLIFLMCLLVMIAGALDMLQRSGR